MGAHSMWGFDNYYGYRSGFYDPWMDYSFATETHVSEYTEGTFNIDLVDARQKKLVETVNRGVPHYFATFPFTVESN